jgi:hypothetical protein
MLWIAFRMLILDVHHEWLLCNTGFASSSYQHWNLCAMNVSKLVSRGCSVLTISKIKEEVDLCPIYHRRYSEMFSETDSPRTTIVVFVEYAEQFGRHKEAICYNRATYALFPQCQVLRHLLIQDYFSNDESFRHLLGLLGRRNETVTRDWRGLCSGGGTFAYLVRYSVSNKELHFNEEG